MQNSKLFNQRMRKAKKWAKVIGQNLNVAMVALTGSMASGKIAESSDIDFFVQVASKRIWSARFLIMLKLKLAGELPDRYNRAGKICLNWWADFNAPQKNRVKHIVLFQGTPDQPSQPEIWENFCKLIQTWRLRFEKKRGRSIIKMSSHEVCLRHKIDYHTLD